MCVCVCVFSYNVYKWGPVGLAHGTGEHLSAHYVWPSRNGEVYISMPFRWTQSQLTLCRSTISLKITNCHTRGRTWYNMALLTCVADSVAFLKGRNQIFTQRHYWENSNPSNDFVTALEFLSAKNIRVQQLPWFTLLAIRERDLDRDRSMHSCRRLDLRLRSCTHVCFRLLTHRRGRRPSVCIGR